MGSEAEQAEALIAGAVLAADTTGITGVFRLLLDGTAQSVALPTVFNGKFLSLKNDSLDDLDYGFSIGAAQAITINQVSTPGTGNVVAGYPLFTKTAEDKLVPLGTKQVYLNVRSKGANAGWLVYYVSERLQ